MAITKFENAQSLFVGQGDLIIWDTPSDYSVASLATFANPRSLGQIVQDSTSWEGDEVNTDEIKDEQGNVITARVTAGTLSFSFDIASTSADMVKKFLKGKDIATITGATNTFTGDVTAVGFGVDLPVFTAPIGIFNDELKRAWIYPKAKVTSNLAYSDGLWRIHAVVLAEQIDTANLMTGMIVEGTANYGS